MTEEAKNWIQDLTKNPRRVFHEINSDSINGLESVILDGAELTEEEWDKAMHFALNGSPGISIEIRN